MDQVKKWFSIALKKKPAESAASGAEGEVMTGENALTPT
jgi:hypothetical protein